MSKKSNCLSALLAFFVALSVSMLPACSSSSGAGDSNRPSQESQQAAEEPAKTGTLSLALKVAGWESNGQSVPVSISGTTEAGEKVEQTAEVVPGSTEQLDLPAGSYDFSVDGAKVSTSTVVYQTASAHADFSAEDDSTVALDVAEDTAATEELARKAEEEAAAKAQAEAEAAAQAQAEAEAAAKAQAEAEAKAQTEAAARQKAEEEAAAAQRNEQTVYVTNSGKKYHRDGCQYLKKSKIPISLSSAQSQGYTPCSKCF